MATVCNEHGFHSDMLYSYMKKLTIMVIVFFWIYAKKEALVTIVRQYYDRAY